MTDAMKTFLEKNKVDEKVIYDTLTTSKRTYEQKVLDLAHLAENQLNVLDIPDKTLHYFSTGAINDLFEGHAPYRPRYVMVDFDRYMKNGSKFLRINPPKTFDEAIFALMTIYHHIPSITNFPVYLGNLDYLLDPFIKDLSDEEVKTKIRLFLNFLDRTIDDSFCHANIGPKETRMGKLLLEVEQDLANTVPNLTIKYNSKITSDEFMKLAIATSLKCSNPALCNDDINSTYYDSFYGISSCYNILPIRGGAYTLTRLTLTKLAEETSDINKFINEVLPEALKCIADYENERIKFFVEKSGFFESSFLVKEGLIDKDRFVPMFGITGLAECVNTLLKDKNLKYGLDKEADDLGVKIMEKIEEVVSTFKAEYTPLTSSHFMLHAQVGLDSDKGITSGVRIPVGDEPENFADHLRHSSRYHKFFPAGVGDIFPIASNVTQNMDAMLDVVKGAFNIGVHYMSFYSSDTDLVRITGYLVKRSEMAKYFNDEAVIKQTTALGAENYKTNQLQNRKVRMG
jgi:YjjI family glycine radical enzyme